MSVQKTTTIISNNITLTAGGGDTTSAAVTTLGWHKMVHLKLTNGATPPTTPAQAVIQGSPDNTNWYTFQAGQNTSAAAVYLGPTTASGVNSYTVLVWSAVQYVRVVWTAGDTQNVTARAELSEAVEFAESHTDTSNALVKAGDAANNAIRCNIVAGGGTGNGTAMSDKGAFTEGTTAFTPVGGVFNETIAADPTEDQAAAARITAKRAVHTNLRNTSGTEIATSANPVRIDPTGTTTQPTTDSQTITDNAAFTDGTSKVLMSGYVFDETAGTALTENDAAAARVDSKRATVHVIEDATTRGQRATVTAANALKVDGSAVTQPVSQATASSLNAQVVGEVASGAADSGNPQKIGGQTRITNPAAVTNGQRVNAIFDKVGRLIVAHGHCRELITTNHITLTTTTETTLIAAGGAGVFNDLISLNFANTSATATTVSIRDATAGTVRLSFRLAAGGQASYNINQLFPQVTANNNWTAQLITAVTDVRITGVAIINI